MSQLVTGEAVVLDLRTAGVPSRILAALIDFAVQLVAFFVLLLVIGLVASGASAATTAGLMIGVIVLVLLGYPVLMETLARGRTLGKMALGLRVVRDDGGPIGFRQAITRGLLGLFVEKPGFMFPGLVTALLNEHAKRLGDLLAGTVVVQERVASTRSDSIVMPPPLAGWATTLDLSALPDDLAESARSYLGRYATLTPTAQADLGGRIASAVVAVVTPPPPPNVPAWAYLSAVLAERRRRAGYAGQQGWSYSGPAPGYAAPAPGYGPPPPGYGPPSPGYGAPPAAYGAPATTAPVPSAAPATPETGPAGSDGPPTSGFAVPE